MSLETAMFGGDPQRMRWVFLYFLAVLAAAVTPAMAQTSITLAADPVPIVAARINGRPVRLEVVFIIGDMLALNPAVAERLGVRRVPVIGVKLLVDDSTSVRGRLARPRLVFEDGSAARAFAGIFPVPVTDRADGIIGPGALPHDVITIVLGPDLPGAREIVLPLADPDLWAARTQVGQFSLGLGFNVSRAASVFNRTAASALDGAGLIVADGELTSEPVILGLTTMMQPVRTALTIEGLALGPAFARTRAPLLGAYEEDAIVVEAQSGNPTPPGVSLGREALSVCSSISVNRRTRQLTLRCAG